jgi:hypothetical protein
MRKLVTVCSLLTAFAIAGGVSSANAQNAWKRLCTNSGEKPYVGCILRNGKSLAFCVPKGQDPQHTGGRTEAPRVSFMTYRIAKPDGRVELTFPNRRAGSAGMFDLRLRAYSRGGSTDIWFQVGRYTYRYTDQLVARGQGKGHDRTHGMSVYLGKRKLSFLQCAAAVTAPPRTGRPTATPPVVKGGKVARCRITGSGRVNVNRRCLFKPGGRGEGAGSFSLQNISGNGALFGDILVVTVSVTSPGVAQVFGLTRAGNNSRWGRAVRSRKNRACWVGTDFSVCAW